jgi:hypothetical protein
MTNIKANVPDYLALPARADYGERIIEQLSIDLRKRHGRGFGRSNLFQIRAFHLAYRDKVQTVFGQSSDQKVQTAFGQLSADYFDVLRKALPLPWSGRQADEPLQLQH